MTRSPGPWRARFDDDNAYFIEAPTGCIGLGFDLPDVLLIAAAPDLLSSLQDVLDHYHAPCDGCFPALARARAAIAKATGEQS